jgi:hypothetical protein
MENDGFEGLGLFDGAFLRLERWIYLPDGSREILFENGWFSFASQYASQEPAGCSFSSMVVVMQD